MRRAQKDRAVGQAQDFAESLYQLRRLSDIRPVNETIQLSPLHEKFFRSERRSVPAAKRFAYDVLDG